MPTELDTLMIKTSGNAQALTPEIKTFGLSQITTVSNDMMADIREFFPQSVNRAESADFAAMLNPEQAESLLGKWLQDIANETLAVSCQYIAEPIDRMYRLSREGFSMIITEG